jgi:hypothetical protein
VGVSGVGGEKGIYCIDLASFVRMILGFFLPSQLVSRFLQRSAYTRGLHIC